jgi:hypothetical protein
MSTSINYQRMMLKPFQYKTLFAVALKQLQKKRISIAEKFN